ncbi:hydroxyacid dehydrogenase [Rubellicoccus peritrichatus]|uniref:Hydroxyacid dehydrogenase n=1 Tax=Rubellicoccus peritrichatus TaxID=3080537 RepID=A0AAQ3L7T9_9BACT|nr:hydroxyacid dehydrogenase [Puniceicoccus sp. CR14]WOO39412.1 hydroxyacid dehydrogenase [Puniceicoccus sp. CR14]
MAKVKGVFLLNDYGLNRIYGDDELDAIASLVQIERRPVRLDDPADSELLAEAEVAFSGWGAPVLDEDLLRRMPKLKALFYGAGTVRYMITDAFWERGIRLTSAYVANARPVAEFTFAQIILALKKTWQQSLHIREAKAWGRQWDMPGAYFGSRIGVVSLGAIGRMVCERLTALDVEVFAYDPFVSDEDMRKIGARKASLNKLCETCDVITLHAPQLDETIGMIREEHFKMMKPGATIINTARGAIIDHPAMIKVLQERTDIVALLDVTDPEPPEPGSLLYTLPNVVMTPHIAGSMGRECRRMARLAIDECRRYLKNESALHPITIDNFSRLA